jgi:hypothetical protein
MVSIRKTPSAEMEGVSRTVPEVFLKPPLVNRPVILAAYVEDRSPGSPMLVYTYMYIYIIYIYIFYNHARRLRLEELFYLPVLYERAF